MSRPVVSLYVTGAPSGPIRERYGTYVDWFGRLLATHEVEMRPVDAIAGETVELDQVDGVVITGSASSLTAPEPWMEPGLALVRAAHARNTPLLGVCFGHQLIGAALGRRVIRNPAGWELATAAIELNQHGRRDPLFDGLPNRFEVNMCHQDVVESAGADRPDSEQARLEVLAGNRKAPIQAMAAGPRMRGVQFHPEFSGPVTAAYIDSRRDLLTEDALRLDAPDDLPDKLLAQVHDSPEGEAVLHNFIRHFVLAR
ncbi:type 1 glutamine amidotransferase [Haliangium sp.]|uniref:type 1 glutamine amidotransferase n=1 Tax=Haliangium sp. TaxID=2663208 RepID=UPI003D11BFA5